VGACAGEVGGSKRFRGGLEKVAGEGGRGHGCQGIAAKVVKRCFKGDSKTAYRLKLSHQPRLIFEIEDQGKKYGEAFCCAYRRPEAKRATSFICMSSAEYRLSVTSPPASPLMYVVVDHSSGGFGEMVREP
jgi:hypothetical protein